MELYKKLSVASTIFLILWIFTNLAEDSTFTNKMWVPLQILIFLHLPTCLKSLHGHLLDAASKIQHVTSNQTSIQGENLVQLVTVSIGTSNV